MKRLEQRINEFRVEDAADLTHFSRIFNALIILRRRPDVSRLATFFVPLCG